MLERAAMSPVPAACGARRAALRRLGLVVLAGVGFLVMAALLRSAQGPVKAPTMRAQLEAFLAEKDEIDAVFVGSSRVQRGVSPRVVDQQLSSEGHPFRSFNIGIPGSRSFETDWVVRRILDAEPEKLRFLVIEAPTWQPELAPRHDFTERYVEWHDARATWLELRAIWRENVSVWGKLDLSWRALRLFVMRSTNYATVGRFSFARDPIWDRVVLGMGRLQGYQPLDTRVTYGARRRAKFLASLPTYEMRVEQLRSSAENGQLVDRAALDTYDRQSLEEQARYVEARGVTPVYLVPPLLHPSLDFSALLREGIIPHLIELKSPLVYPELFDVDNRFDREHMNETGARLMSEAIAQQLAPVIAEAAEKRD